MSLIAKKLYELLPAYYRVRDPGEGEPLKALIEVIAREAGVMEADITRLYENWFIETCAEWVVPYIGDLLGVRGLHHIEDATVFSRRAFVANTLAYRRRKGTASVLEQLAYDTTGWRARVVEFFQLLETTQDINHIRLHNVRTPDLRLTDRLELLDTAFDTIAHTADVRHISGGCARHNIPNIGLFLWRLQSYPMIRSAACPLEGGPAGRYTFSPLGYDSHLFNRPQTEREITHIAEEVNVPGLLRRRPLYDELEARRQTLADGQTPVSTYFDGIDDPLGLEIIKLGSPDPGKVKVKPEEILICNLEDWHLPPKKKIYKQIESDGTVIDVEQEIKAAVDPVLGRVTLAEPAGVESVLVSYAYGFSGDVGAGPYDRQESVTNAPEQDSEADGEEGAEENKKVDWQVGVSKDKTAAAGEKIFKNLKDAVAEWNDSTDVCSGVITIMDNHTYEEDITGGNRVKIGEGRKLLIAAADWPEKDDPELPGVKHRAFGDLAPEELRPHIRGSLEVEGTADVNSLTGGQLVLDGLLLEGGLAVLKGNLGSLTVSHCTLVPGHSGLEVNPQNERLKIQLNRTICGPVRVDAAASKLLVEECIVDNGEKQAVYSPGTPIQLEKSTVFGSIRAREIEAGNCIFKGPVNIERRQAGCIRFSYVPIESKTPRRFRCQPDLEIKTRIAGEEEKKELSEADEEIIKNSVLQWLAPAFTSTGYGHHAYAQLSRTCPEAVAAGADDGSEMGVFNHLEQPQREANLRTALDEYLRLGLEAGIIYVT
jgi:hypothetical protein